MLQKWIWNPIKLTEPGRYPVVLGYISFNGTLKTQHPKLILCIRILYFKHIFRYLQLDSIFLYLNFLRCIALISEIRNNHCIRRDLKVSLYSIFSPTVTEQGEETVPCFKDLLYRTASIHVSDKGKLWTSDFFLVSRSLDTVFFVADPLVPCYCCFEKKERNISKEDILSFVKMYIFFQDLVERKLFILLG